MINKTVNEVQLIGYVLEEPVLSETKKGIPVCTFSLTTKREWNVGQEKRTDNTHHICVAWHKLGLVVHEYLHVNDLVRVVGRLENHTYVDTNQIERKQTEIIVESFIVL